MKSRPIVALHDEGGNGDRRWKAASKFFHHPKRAARLGTPVCRLSTDGILPRKKMMKKAKRITRITLETERVLVIRGQRSRDVWCDVCGAQVQMVTLGEASSIAGVSELVVCRRIDARSLHSTETPDGRIFICLNSLLG